MNSIKDFYFPLSGLAMGVRVGRGSGKARGCVRGARRRRRITTGPLLLRPQAAGIGGRRPTPHETTPQGTPIRLRKAP